MIVYLMQIEFHFFLSIDTINAAADYTHTRIDLITGVCHEEYRGAIPFMYSIHVHEYDKLISQHLYTQNLDQLSTIIVIAFEIMPDV